VSDRKKQELLPPSNPRFPAATEPPRPSLPSLPAGNARFGTQVSVYQRNTRAVAASADYMRARADQAAACMELVLKREELALAIARLAWLPERCAHEYEKGRLSRLSELRILKLQHERDEIDAQIAVAAAKLQLAQYQPQPETPSAPPPAPAPMGLTPADVQKAAQMMPELKPESIETLLLMLGGLLAEKTK